MKKISVSEDLIRVKDLIGRASNVRVRNIREEVLIQLRELGLRVDDLEEKLDKEGNSSVGMKRKNQILFLLKDKRMSADEIGKVLNLSRTRVNECLRSMEKDAILSGDFSGKKKYYFLNVKKG
jgi:biotin operon repressor